MKKITLAQFIGRQLSRLKAGTTYYMIAVSTISALGIINIAFPDIEIWFLIILFPCVLFGAFLIGYYMDKTNIVTMDQQKTIEMTHRYLNTADYKLNDFHITTMKVMGIWIKSIQNNEPIDETILNYEINEYRKRWKQPEGK